MRKRGRETRGRDSIHCKSASLSRRTIRGGDEVGEGTGEGEEEEGVRRKERERGGECNSVGIGKKIGG